MYYYTLKTNIRCDIKNSDENQKISMQKKHIVFITNE